MKGRRLQSRRRLYLAVAIAGVVAVLIIATQYETDNGNGGSGGGPLNVPTVLLDSIDEGSEHTVTITDVQLKNPLSSRELGQLNISGVWLLLLDNTNLYSDSEVFEYVSGNWTSGLLRRGTVLQASEGQIPGILFVDSDSDGKLSVGDHFSVSKNPLNDSNGSGALWISFWDYLGDSPDKVFSRFRAVLFESDK